MPAYNTVPAIALTPGDSVALVNNAAVDAGITNSQQVHVGPSATISSDRLHVSNTTDKDLTVQAANVGDVTGNYQALKDADTGQAITVASGSDAVFSFANGWIRFNFAVAPTQGSAVISR